MTTKWRFEGEVDWIAGEKQYLVARNRGSLGEFVAHDKEYGLHRMTVRISYRPKRVYVDPKSGTSYFFYHKKYTDSTGKIHYTRARYEIDDFIRISEPYVVGGLKFDAGACDSYFSGAFINIDSYVDSDGESVIVAEMNW